MSGLLWRSVIFLIFLAPEILDWHVFIGLERMNDVGKPKAKGIVVARVKDVSMLGRKVAMCMGPIRSSLEWGGGRGDGVMWRQGCLKVTDEEAFDGGAKNMHAPVGWKPSSDERGMGRKSQASASDDGPKVVPGHVGDISLTGQGGVYS
jgi:hypothetical protein